MSTMRQERINLTLFGIGEGVSLIGSAFYAFVVSLYILKQTGSPLLFALNLTQSILPILFIGPIAGVLVDRVNRKRLAVTVEMLNGLLFLGLFYLLSFGVAPLWMLYLTTFLSSSLSLIFDITLDASKPNLVHEAHLTKINGIDRIISSMSSIMGPLGGGILFAIMDLKAFVLINAISFCVSGVLQIFIDHRFNKGAEEVDRSHHLIRSLSVFDDIKEGASYIREKKSLYDLLVFMMFINVVLAFSIMVTLPYGLNQILHLSSQEYGLIMSFSSIGMIVGALYAVRFARKWQYEQILFANMFVWGTMTVLLAIPFVIGPMSFSFYIVYYSSLMFIMGMTISMVDLPMMEKLQVETQENFRGRVISLTMGACKLVQPIAILIAGQLLMLISIEWIFILNGLAMLLGGQVLFLSYKKGHLL